MHSLRNYMAAATFLSNVGWGQEGSSNMLKNKVDKEDAILIVVRKVVDNCLFCGPQGNWATNNQYGSLKAAKFTFTLGRPDEEVFANDFDSAYKVLGKIQANIVSTPHHEHLLLGEGELFKSIRFTTPVFKEQDKVSLTRC